MAQRLLKLIAFVAFVPFCYPQQTTLYRDVIDLMSSPNVFSVSSADPTITATFITPVNISMQDVFFNTQATQFLDLENIPYPVGLKTIHLLYTVGVSMVTNNSANTIYLVKSSYLVPSDQSQCTNCSIIVPNDDFLGNYPDFSSILSGFRQTMIGFLAAGGVLGGGGLLSLISGLIWKTRFNDPAAIPLSVYLMIWGGLVSTFTGGAFASTGYNSKKTDVDPANDLLNKYNALVASLKPYIIPQQVTLNTNPTTLSQYISNPVTTNIQNNVYQLDPGQTLIEPVIIPVGATNSYSGLSLQYYTSNPGFIYQVHSTLNVGSSGN